ncbi:hypothetical protein T03_14629 [Trichinella britovi]|uniref:Uncharacterized protein n=1 Tax=Trichinella britovi TaxID=45882 RepID=A0A0V1CWC2_TRIBR|nr:hypothetical protein T03_14629 [Trichinella britovi]
MELSATRCVPLGKNYTLLPIDYLIRYLTEVLIICLFSFPVTPTKITSSCNVFLQYLGKCAFMKRAIKFWKVPRQTKAYMSNKWPLKLPCAYLNTQ